MAENDFHKGEKVSWSFGQGEIPGVVKEKKEDKIQVDTGKSTVTRKGDSENPAYVVTMDKGDKKDGKEVAKKGSELHSREDKQDDAPSQNGKGQQESGDKKENDKKEGDNKGGDKKDGEQSEFVDKAQEKADKEDDKPADEAQEKQGAKAELKDLQAGEEADADAVPEVVSDDGAAEVEGDPEYNPGEEGDAEAVEDDAEEDEKATSKRKGAKSIGARVAKKSRGD